jgi:hypothetical protein
MVSDDLFVQLRYYDFPTRRNLIEVCSIRLFRKSGEPTVKSLIVSCVLFVLEVHDVIRL